MPDFLIPVCEVPAGEYPMGSTAIGYSRPPHTVEVAAFAIAQTTVTNAQFAPFIEAGGYTAERYWTDMGWRWQQGKEEREPGFWHDEPFNQPDQPVVGVTWYEAVAYARWLSELTGQGWRLPSEAEWEAAARGQDDEPPRPRNYNTSEHKRGQAWAVTEWGNKSWCGALDMIGNVWEWCNTRWGRNYQVMDYRYPYRADDSREEIDGSHARLIRGGSWFDPINAADPANRARYLPGSRASNIGFRLARNI